MIGRLRVENFKSVRSLDLECGRVNVFVGEPGTGKSNILEALGLLSFIAHDAPVLGAGEHLDERVFRRFNLYVRSESPSLLFHYEDVTRDVLISADGGPEVRLSYLEGSLCLSLGEGPVFRLGTHFYECLDPEALRGLKGALGYVKFYRFRRPVERGTGREEYLRPPDGGNLPFLVKAHPALRRVASELYGRFGYRLMVREERGSVEVVAEREGVLVSIPLAMTSETLWRVLAHLAAVLTNRGSTVVFEEPEAHSFPYYTKFLAEVIARDRDNQYFVSTHNPYFLASILEKAPRGDVRVVVTYWKDGSTRVRVLEGGELDELLEVDPFFNLERYVPQGTSRV